MVNGNGHFQNSYGVKLELKEITGEIVRFVNEDPHSFYRLVIGTDSQAVRKNGVREINFVTAIVIHRIGKGARYFWKKLTEPRVPVLRDKIYRETLMSLDTAENLVPEVRKAINGSAKYDLEIHIDVGPVGPTREMIREVVGMVTGVGYVAKTKPESWGASSVADKHT